MSDPTWSSSFKFAASFSLSLVLVMLNECFNLGVTSGEIDGVTVKAGNVTVGDSVSGDKVVGDGITLDRSGSVGVTAGVTVLDDVTDGSKNATNCEIFFGVLGVGGIDGDLMGNGLLEKGLAFIILPGTYATPAWSSG